MSTADIKERGAVGVRAQLLHVASGRLEKVFVVYSVEGSTRVNYAVSPAWTSALAVGHHVVQSVVL